MDRLSHALNRRSRQEWGLAVLFLDLDRFKWLNDSLGHAAGDEVLVTVAERLGNALRVEDTLARFGGDEFVVLCEGVTTEGEAQALGARPRSVLTAPVSAAGEETTLTVSVGIAYLAPAGRSQTADALVRDADAAMYRAKERGRDRQEVFDVETLVRWDHPRRGLLEPSQFISLAEDTGLVVPLGTKVLSAPASRSARGRSGARCPRTSCCR